MDLEWRCKTIRKALAIQKTCNAFANKNKKKLLYLSSSIHIWTQKRNYPISFTFIFCCLIWFEYTFQAQNSQNFENSTKNSPIPRKLNDKCFRMNFLFHTGTFWVNKFFKYCGKFLVVVAFINFTQKVDIHEILKQILLGSEMSTKNFGLSRIFFVGNLWNVNLLLF